jgi:hypothetical protein
MQKKNYQQFQDEQEAEMQNYPTGIPVGQPITTNPYPQPYPVEQYHPQVQHAQPHMQPIMLQHAPYAPQGMLPPPPQMPLQMYFFIKLGLKIIAILFRFNVHAAR